MKCLKVDDYIKRTSSVKETVLLHQELENYVKSRPGLQGRTLCDRVIRACNHQLGVDPPDFTHITELVKLVEVALNGYDIAAANVPQSSPLYMEKIIFHIVKKLSALEMHSLCSHVTELLHNRLTQAQKAEDYCVLARSCFSVLWNGLTGVKDKMVLNPRDKLHCQMQALSFLLLLDTGSATPSNSKTPIYTQDAVVEFESSCGEVTKEDSLFLLQEFRTLYQRCWTDEWALQRDKDQQSAETLSLPTLCEMVLIIVKVFCKASHYDLASTLLDEIERNVKDFADHNCTALALGKWAVKIHSALKSGQDSGQALTECARTLRSLSADIGVLEAHAVLEACALVVWAVENGNTKALSGPVLLTWFSFLDEYQEQISGRLKKNSICQAESSRLQQVLCFSIYQGFVFAYESMRASQLEDSDTLDRVLLYCQSTAGQVMTELHQLSSENLLIKAVIAVSNLACGLYNRRLYDQAFKLVEIICKDLYKNCPASLPVDRLIRPFMLAVQTSRRAGQLERALDWVILWLKALGDKITSHMAEPVSLWVKTKVDAARNSEEDIRLRTLRDGFGPDVPDEGVMLCLLDEELRAYKEVAADTAQERYNTLCDLLDICHEESSHTHQRAVYLCEMAQVVCFQDFSEQTDCTAVDFIHESLRLLEEEPKTQENADRLRDDKAHALLWLYICSLEKNLQETITREKKLKDLREQAPCVANSIGTNDFEYEDKQRDQHNSQVYDSLHLNLAAEKNLSQPLESALDEWSTLLKDNALPSVRSPKQTCSSIAMMAALFKLMGKPIKALEAYQLAIGVARHLVDAHSCASSLCQSASILLDLGSPELALAQLEEAEKFVTSDTTAEGPSSLFMLVTLLKAQYCCTTGQMDRGVSYLCEVLKEVNEQRQSKSWYLLRAQTLQVCGSYLSLDTATLPQAQRNLIKQHGISSPDTALYESLKLLGSLLVTLVGKGLYGATGGSTDVRFVDQGDNLMVKWQLLSELLNCSMKVVSMRSSCGAIYDARLQCLEAIKLAIKLQALSQCAELLVVKAELDLMQGQEEESGFDLDNVKNLLELGTDFSDQKQKADVKIKPRKGRPAQKPEPPLPSLEDDFKDILSTRWISKEPVVSDLSSSPPLKAMPCRWLSSLAHEPDCQCPCCSEPCLGRVTARWAAARADLALQLDPADAKISLKLHWTALARCKNVTAKLGAKLAKLFSANGTDKGSTKPSFMHDIVGRVYLHMATSGLDPSLSKVCSVWKILEAGLAFIDSVPSPMLTSVRAGLMATKAIVSLVTLAANKECIPEELFSDVWMWKAPNETKELKQGQKQVKIKDTKKLSVVKPKIKVTGSSSRGKSLVPMTPVTAKSSTGELGIFDFNTVVPTLTCTPLQKVKTTALTQRAPKTACKLQFHVYEELSPVQLVPAAPKRPKKTLFKVEFSDESDTEANTQAEIKEKAQVPKKRTTTRKAANSGKTSADPPPDKAPTKKQTRVKKSTGLPQTTSSEDEQPISVRRGRTRGMKSKMEVETLEEPDKMRAIEEEPDEVLDMSIEQLRTSDTETEDNSSSCKSTDVDFEVLRRDMCFELEKNDLSKLKSRGPTREGLQTHLPHADSRPDNLSLADVQSLLRSAWLHLQHIPSPTIFPTLCALLSLTLGQQDPVTTAMLQAQSLGISSRHRTIRHLASCLKKLRKTSSELTEKMDALTLDELTVTESKTSTEQRLSQLENIFSFPIADLSFFPQSHCQEFMQQIQHIPTGVTVCLLSVTGVKPRQTGDSIILTRLEKDSAPVTVHIPTSRQQHPISWMLKEIDSIKVEQKVVSRESEKDKWWEGRRALDARVEQLLKEMETVLRCWKSLLLPLSSDPQLSSQAHSLYKALSAKGVRVSEEMLKAVLSASPELSPEDLKTFGLGLSPQWDVDCERLLDTAVSRFARVDESHGHVVLILDKHLQKLPWESISVLKSHSVSRMPSLHSLIGLSIQKENDPQSLLKHGVDLKKVFYVLDPDGNLENAQDQFRGWFSSKPGWEGVCGVAPYPGQLAEAVTSKDLYIYIGHGAGSRFLDGQSVLRQQMKAASLLFGCSSAALAVRGDQEGQGIILNYLIAGCPFILGNLWDVTDRDIDRFTKALFESWFSAGHGAPLLEYMGPARQATHLKHLIGAAPVVYGLPIHLQ